MSINWSFCWLEHQVGSQITSIRKNEEHATPIPKKDNYASYLFKTRKNNLQNEFFTKLSHILPVHQRFIYIGQSKCFVCCLGRKSILSKELKISFNRGNFMHHRLSRTTWLAPKQSNKLNFDSAASKTLHIFNNQSYIIILNDVYLQIHRQIKTVLIKYLLFKPD